MRRFLIALVAVAGFLTPATAAFAASPEPTNSIGVRLLDVPTNRRNDPRARLYIVDHVAPGTTIQRRIEVSNTTSSAADVSLYAAAASVAHGAFTVAGGRTPDELSTWTSLDRDVVPVASGGRQPVTVTIRVPQDASPGERYAVVWAELASPPPADGGVTTVNRVGIRIYLSVGPGGEPPVNFVVDSLTAERAASGEPVVKALVHNTGGRALDMSGTLALSDGPGGLSAGPFAAKLGTTLAIADTEAVTIPLDARLPDGPWHAQIQLRSGLLTRSAQATITFPHAAGRAAKPAAVHTAFPWTAVLLAVTALLLVSVLLAAKRRRRKMSGQGTTPPAAARGT